MAQVTRSFVFVALFMSTSAVFSSDNSYFGEDSKLGSIFAKFLAFHKKADEPKHGGIGYVILKKPEHKCEYNEKWYSCLPTCPVTCSNIHRDCIQNHYPCKEGCDCRSGYARHYLRGPCVPVKTCHESKNLRCLRNEEWIQGEEEPDCENDCHSLKCHKRGHSKSTGGCYCKIGFVRDLESDSCIKFEDCPNFLDQCPENEVFRECGSRNEELCENNWGLLFSSRSCTSGCFCKAGYSRIQGRCRRSSKCPVRCDRGEIKIGDKCVCKDGFLSANGKCVCPIGEVEINNRCENKIDCGNGTAILIPPNCKRNCQQSCLCTDTFSLIDGKCICGSGKVLVNGKCESIITCVDGTPILEPPNCANNCVSQSCNCFKDFTYEGNGNCVCHGNSVDFPYGCMTNCESKVCINCLGSNEKFTDSPPKVEEHCAGYYIITTPGKYCFCYDNYCRRDDSCIVK